MQTSEDRTLATRIQAVDLLRGIVMIIMALDHTRDFFHSAIGNPIDPSTTTPELYATRWVTHFCAPVFVFLSGLSAWLQSKRKSPAELAFFLITRGLWLVLVDIFIMSFALFFDIKFQVFVLETIWAIGISMTVLGLLIRLPYRIILALGILIVAGHNLLDFHERSVNGQVPVWWKILHLPGIIPVGETRFLYVLYPCLPWIGLMLLGYCTGKLFTDYTREKRKRILAMTGAAAILLFILLRFINVYGDTQPWKDQGSTLKNVFAFMNVQKYPPSLLFMCATIGPALLFLAFVRERSSVIQHIIQVYGRVPLFYFVVHFYILHVATAIAFLLRGHTFKEGIDGTGQQMHFVMPGEGFNLAIVYLIWLLLVILMYPLCKKFGNYKLRNKHMKWLSYI